MTIPSLPVQCYVSALYTLFVTVGIFPRKILRPAVLVVARDLLVLSLLSLALPLAVATPLAVAITTYLAVCLYKDLPGAWVDPKGRNVLVTGCDQGIGHALALHLDKIGFTVFAGCLFKEGEGAKALASEGSDRLVTLQLDITDPEQTSRAVSEVRARLGGQHLHGVVNNAGVLYLGNVEVMGHRDMTQMLKVNLEGLLNVYRGFLPLLRATALVGDGGGGVRLVNVASNVGLAPASQMAVYGASKAAVALLSETWRSELKPLGIQVATIVPSGFRTGIMGYDREVVAKRWWSQASQEVQDYFGWDCFLITNKQKDYKTFLNPDFSAIVHCMTDALLSRRPRTFYYKGLLARSVPFLYLHCPSWLWDRVTPLLADYYRFPVKALQIDSPQRVNGHGKKE